MTYDGNNKPIVEVRNLTKQFGKGHAAVRAVADVSLTVAKGEIVLIMGPSGSGKTTLLTLIGALLTPDSGSIRVNNDTISKHKVQRLAKFRRNHIGFIFQSFNLLAA